MFKFCFILKIATKRVSVFEKMKKNSELKTRSKSVIKQPLSRSYGVWKWDRSEAMTTHGYKKWEIILLVSLTMILQMQCGMEEWTVGWVTKNSDRVRILCERGSFIYIWNFFFFLNL